jgi:histidyl-tRNA synthetase
MFRGERPQKGRLRQFHQIGVEVLGPLTAHPYFDAEVISLNVKLLKAFGLDKFELKINTLGSPKDKERFSESLRKLLKPQVSGLCEECQNRFKRNVFRILDCKNKACRHIVGGLRIDHSHLSGESQAYFDQVKGALDGLSVTYSVCYELVRGLDYYTHTVFEITGSSLGSQDALSAGGRYNDLVKQLGGPDVPAIGFALGIERVLLATTGPREAFPVPISAFIIALDERSLQRAFQMLNDLRDHNVSSDMNYRVASMKSQMRLADKSGARSVIIIGESEFKREIVTLKDMATGGQEEIAVKSNDYSLLCSHLRERYP